MSILYVKEQGAYVTKNVERVEVTKNRQTLLSFPAENIEGLSIFGNVQISTQAIQLLIEKGVDISIFTYSGKLLGQIKSESSKNIFLRFAQFDSYQNMESRIQMARIIVENKIHNQMNLMRDYRYKDDFSPRDALKKMERMLIKLDKCETSNELMGIEGMCSNLYFSCFSHMISCDFAFHGRNRRPPRDPINVILSLTYTFLTKEISNALEAEAFEVYLGFLHGIRYGRKSLALDIVEEFRQPAADRYVVRCFNLRIFNKHDFTLEDNRVVLEEDGFRKFCKKYEEWMMRPVRDGEKSFRQIIRQQAHLLRNAIQDGREYQPYRWKEKN